MNIRKTMINGFIRLLGYKAVNVPQDKVEEVLSGKREAPAQTPEQIVEQMEAVERRRRENCIHMACHLEGAADTNVTEIAQNIYDWTYGKKEG